jgi:fructose-bisphosphate aldolase class II
MPAESLKLTAPQEAAQFVAETRADVLAPAVGNMHGRLPSMVRGEIKQATGAFLTLHGGSKTAYRISWPPSMPVSQFIHIITELAWRGGAGSRPALKAPAHDVTPYKILPGAKPAIEDVVAQRLASFNSNGRS